MKLICYETKHARSKRTHLHNVFQCVNKDQCIHQKHTSKSCGHKYLFPSDGYQATGIYFFMKKEILYNWKNIKLAKFKCVPIFFGVHYYNHDNMDHVLGSIKLSNINPGLICKLKRHY